jgi:hypothetical protein
VQNLKGERWQKSQFKETIAKNDSLKEKDGEKLQMKRTERRKITIVKYVE